MQQKRLIKLSDIIFSVAIAAVALVVWLFMLQGDAGAYAVIRRDGAVIAELPLSQNARYEVVGNYTNVFEIKDGAIYVEKTDCPGLQCKKTGAVSQVGTSIVCAPNHVSVTITGEGAEVDAITG